MVTCSGGVVVCFSSFKTCEEIRRTLPMLPFA